MSVAFDRLKEAVRKNNDRGDAFIEFVRGVVAELRANAEDPVAINAAADQLEAQAGEFDAAIIENTPTQPTP